MFDGAEQRLRVTASGKVEAAGDRAFFVFSLDRGASAYLAMTPRRTSKPSTASFRA